MKRKDLKKIIKENIGDWLSERLAAEADSGDMAYTEKASLKEVIFLTKNTLLLSKTYLIYESNNVSLC